MYGKWEGTHANGAAKPVSLLEFAIDPRVAAYEAYEVSVAIRVLSDVYFLPPAHRVAVSPLQFAENDCGDESHRAKHKERAVDTMNELQRIGTVAIGKEEGSY